MSEANPFNVLVADDEESIRSIVAEVLCDEGYTVEQASNGSEALARVKEGGIHVVITDIRMPEMSGMELLEAVKEYDNSIEVIIMTSYASIDTAIKAIRLGAYDYLTKPFEDLSIISTVVDRTIGKLRLEVEVRKLLTALKKKNQAIQDLYRQTTQLFKIDKLDEILHVSTKGLAELSGNKHVCFYSLDLKKRTLTPTHCQPETWDLPKITLQPDQVEMDYFRTVNDDVFLKSKIAGNKPSEHTLIETLFSGKDPLGLYVIHSPDQPLDPDASHLLLQYMGNACVHSEKASLHATIESMAIKDGLTNLYNHRHFKETLTQELARAKRFENDLSIVLFDIDNFKNYNDTNGHQSGDELLKKMAQIIRDTGRETDMAARYGGEEFILILTGTDKEGAATKAENLRKIIEETPFAHREKQPLGKVTISGGYAEFPADGATVEELIEAADKALYKAKEGGRNQLLPAEPTGRSAPGPTADRKPETP